MTGHEESVNPYFDAPESNWFPLQDARFPGGVR